jgi:hypothetical protein
MPCCLFEELSRILLEIESEQDKEFWRGSSNSPHKHLAFSRVGLQFTFGKRQRTANKNGVWAETQLPASNSKSPRPRSCLFWGSAAHLALPYQ